MRAPLLVWALAAAFLLLVASLLIGSFTKPEFPPYELGPHPDGTRTLDASRGDQWQWWGDVGFRRNRVITARGAVARDLGPVNFDSLTEVPADEGGEGGQGGEGGGYSATLFGADTVNPGIGKWYSYSMMSHLLTSQHHVYAIRTAQGDFVALEIVAYYCREVGAACYTIRYKTTRPRATSSGARK